MLDKNTTEFFHTAVIKVLTFDTRKEMKKKHKALEDLSMREDTIWQKYKLKQYIRFSTGWVSCSMWLTFPPSCLQQQQQQQQSSC